MRQAFTARRRAREPLVLAAWVLLALFASRMPAGAQIAASRVVVGETRVEVRTHDGMTRHGRVVAVGAVSFSLETDAGVRIDVPLSHVSALGPARGRMIEGEPWPEDPLRARLLFSPSARPLRRGEGHVGVHWLVVPFAGYGVTDAFTVAGGATPFPPGLLGGMFYLAPKLTLVSRPGLDLSVASFAILFGDVNNGGPHGLLYGVGTIGGPDRALTLGAGWGFKEVAAIYGSRLVHAPVALLAFETRSGRHYKLLTENWLGIGLGNENFWGISMGGIRAFRDSRSAEAGVAFWLDRDGIRCCLPILNFGFHFGGGR